MSLTSEKIVVVKKKEDKAEKFYATGRRKTASAKVWISKGEGKFVVNGKDINSYFTRKLYSMYVQQPISAVDQTNQIDVVCSVSGGGLLGQSGAVRHGVSRALNALNPTFRPILKENGFLTRDSRKVERKKYGQKGARAKFQFSKR
ncbi:MAG: 30S ribosomal protein S9 [Proteobacteria bacterium]|nr:30S ribosomal protein S9 [Pseudomonadota bacterium]